MTWLLAASVVLGACALVLILRETVLARRNPSAVNETVIEAVPLADVTTDVFDVHPTGVVIATADGRIAIRNQAAQRLAGTHVGVLVDEMIERRIELQLQTADDAASAVNTDDGETIELYGPPKLVVVVTSRSLPGGGCVVFIDDVTEARRIDQVRTDFVANISHELKTPIGAIAVLAEALVGEHDPAVIERVAGRMGLEAERASSTIDDLMELSRIELDLRHKVTEVAATEIVTEAIERVGELAAQKSIEIVRSDVSGLSLRGDRRQLVSAIGNLVENAVKYSDDGARVRIDVGEKRGWVEIAVADSGIGIPQRDLDRIFERFYRVDRARSRDTGGTGLGLSIVRHVASNHDGEVLVTSVEGGGTTFVVRLPARQEAAAP